MRYIPTSRTLKGMALFALTVICSTFASAQVYYMNIYEKNGNRVRYQISELDSVSLSFEEAPTVKYVHVIHLRRCKCRTDNC